MVTPHVQYCIQMQSPQYRRDMDLLERVQRRATEMIQGMEHLSYETGSESWGCSAWRRLQGDLRVAFQHLKGSYKKEADRLFHRVYGDRTRGNGFKLKEDKFRLDIREISFTVRMMMHWNRLPRDMADALFLETFKMKLDKALGNLI